MPDLTHDQEELSEKTSAHLLSWASVLGSYSLTIDVISRATLEAGKDSVSLILFAINCNKSESFVLVLAGYHTNALVSYLTSAAGMENLHKARSVHGNPAFFEAVVVAEINDMNPLRGWIVDFKPFREQK